MRRDGRGQREVVGDRHLLGAAMTNANVFPSMVLQMCAIGEESGSIDHMLGKAADFYEAEVDEMVAGLSSLMEPIIIVFLGTLTCRQREARLGEAQWWRCSPGPL